MRPDAPVIGALAAVAARLGALSELGPYPAARIPPRKDALQAEVFSHLGGLISHLEQCADGVAVGKLDGLTRRLERVARLDGTAGGGAAAEPMPEMLSKLESLAARLEAVA